MSKSVGNVADPFEAIEEFGIDAIRFYLCRVGGRFRDDTDWSRTQLDKHKREIQSQLGNLLLRITSPKITAQANLASPSTLSSIYSQLRENQPDSPLLALLDATMSMPRQMSSSMERLELGDALDAIMEVLRVTNKTITDIEPWKATTLAADVAACQGASLESLRVVGICLQPFMPGVAGRLLDALGIKSEARTWAAVEEKAISEQWTHPIPKSEVEEAVRLF
ncbi:hypothetical protein H0H93_003314 [Arthromyces matolae]|nr:hypothetical protein H0H93_003314 [Arthromyces matolae]